jgi:hypothetical protein
MTGARPPEAGTVGGLNAMRSAMRPATIVRSCGENCDTLLRTWSAPNTASTISCTVCEPLRRVLGHRPFNRRRERLSDAGDVRLV